MWFNDNLGAVKSAGILGFREVLRKYKLVRKWELDFTQHDCASKLFFLPLFPSHTNGPCSLVDNYPGYPSLCNYLVWYSKII